MRELSESELLAASHIHFSAAGGVQTTGWAGPLALTAGVAPAVRSQPLIPALPHRIPSAPAPIPTVPYVRFHLR